MEHKQLSVCCLTVRCLAQGAGKDILFENFLIPKVLGVRACHQTENIKTITGEHALGLENSVFVLYDEANNNNLSSSIDMLKSIITKDLSHEINPKGLVANTPLYTPLYTPLHLCQRCTKVYFSERSFFFPFFGVRHAVALPKHLCWSINVFLHPLGW